MQYSGFIQSVERDVRRVGTELVAAKADANRLAAASSMILKIEQVDTVTEAVVKTYESVAQAARTLNIPSHVIQQCINGKVPEVGGFKWQLK